MFLHSYVLAYPKTMVIHPRTEQPQRVGRVHPLFALVHSLSCSNSVAYTNHFTYRIFSISHVMGIISTELHDQACLCQFNTEPLPKRIALKALGEELLPHECTCRFAAVSQAGFSAIPVIFLFLCFSPLLAFWVEFSDASRCQVVLECLALHFFY